MGGSQVPTFLTCSRTSYPAVIGWEVYRGKGKGGKEVRRCRNERSLNHKGRLPGWRMEKKVT